MAGSKMLEFHSQGFNGYAVKYSPFFDSKLAVAAAANYGLVGNGRLYILDLTPQGIVAEKWYDTQDSLYDVTWSELHSAQLLVPSGDGTLKLYDTGLAAPFPIASFAEHKREVFATSWSPLSKTSFLSSSWDGSVKIWAPNRSASLLTLPTHACTYSAAFSPHTDGLLSAVSSDSRLRLFDLRAPPSAANHLVLSIDLHAAPTPPVTTRPGIAAAATAAVPPSEALTHDWNKYRDTVVAAAGVDRVLRTFDIRAPAQGPLAVLAGHGYAVRRLAWSPHLSDVLLSASYDMTCRVWRDGSALGLDSGIGGRGGPEAAAMGMGLLGLMDRHTEFVMGVDWCLFGAEGWCASCGWDERVLVWDARDFMGR